MFYYMLRRIIWTPILLLVISLIVFIMGQYGPGDPVEVQLGQNYSEERAERIRESKGLNDPLFIQYFRYIGKSINVDSILFFFLTKISTKLQLSLYRSQSKSLQGTL